MGYVDHHSETVHLTDDGAAMVIETVVLCGRTAGIGEVVSPVVSRKLGGAQAEAVEIAEHTEVSIEIEATLQIEDSRDASAAIDSFDVGGGQSEFDLVPVAGQLRKS